MLVLNLTKEEFSNLEPLHLVEGTIEKESNMFYVPNSYIQGNNKEIIKMYKNYRDKLYVMEKIRTLRNLLKYTKEVSFPELLVPTGIALVDNEIVGTIYPEIDGYTVRTFLNSTIISIETKIKILSKIGALLEKIKDTNPKYNAAFADVHIDNFLVNEIILNEFNDIEDLSIVACDTDSMKLMDSPGIPGYYLYDVDKLGKLQKYKLDSSNFVLPDTNTDIYCFIMIILDLISESHFVYSLNIDTYNRYIDYLDKIGVDSNLLKSFLSVYEDDKDNINPLPYLKSLTKIDKEASLISFYKNYKR